MGKGHQRARAALLQQYTNDLTGLELERARAINPLFLELLGQLGSEQEGANAAIGRVLGEGLEFDRLFPAEEAARIEADRQRSVSTLGLQDEDLLQRAIAELGGPSEESLARIRGIADTQTQIGLSDIGRFRDETFDSIRQRSAGRGLRPTDSPILTEFSESGEEYGRQAQQLVTGIRQRALEQELAYPSLALGQITQASDLLNRRRQFESQLAQQAEAQRLNLAGGIRDTTLNTVGQTPQGTRQGAQTVGYSGQVPLGDKLQSYGQIATALAGVVGVLSDERAKTEIEDIDASTILDKIRAYRFRYKDPEHGEGPQVGVMAQEVRDAGLAHAVFEGPDGYLRIDPARLSGSTLAFVADIHRRVRALEGA